MSLIYKHMFLLADFLRGDRSLGKLRDLRMSQYWEEETLKEWQLKKLNDLLIHAKASSPFYAERLKNIHLPLNDLKMLENIPVLTKQDINLHADQIKCSNIPGARLVESNTGGSTGEPLSFFCDRLSLGWRRASVLRSSEWAGITLGAKNAQMTGSHFEYTKSKKLLGKFKLGLSNGKNMPIAVINDDILDGYYHALVSWKPRSMWGYASGVYYFAKFIRKNYPGTDFGFLKAVITSSETLQDYQRELINEVFGSNKVFDHYGASEFYVAAECSKHGGYHINADILILEITDKDGIRKEEGESGRVIITDLFNFAFPFIRYEIGDVAVQSGEKSCGCGIKLPLLKSIEGRIADAVVLPDRILTAPNFTNIFRAYKGVEQYQILQKRDSGVEVKVVKDQYFTDEFETHIKYSLDKLLGEGHKYEIDYVDSIETPKSGKRRYIISEFAKDAV